MFWQKTKNFAIGWVEGGEWAGKGVRECSG